MKEPMNSLASAIFGVLLQIGFCSGMLAALVKLDVSIPVKLLIGGSVTLLALLILKLGNLGENLTDQLRQILHYQRVTFISVEISRLEPENRRPAQDILVDDINRETTSANFRKMAGDLGLISYLLYALYIVATVALTWFLMAML